MLATLAALAVAMPVTCGTPDRGRDVTPHHYVFFRRDHHRIADSTFLANPAIVGAQLTFTWRELEPTPGHYALDAIRERLTFLQRHGKRLFVQLQDVSFSERLVTPDYLRSDTAYHGGIAAKYERAGGGPPRFSGWVARRWDPAVRERYTRLLAAIAREFDGAVEGVVLPETAVGFEDPAHEPPGFSAERYAAGVREMLVAARGAFQRSCVVIYANFMPGESLPAIDRGYLRGVHALAAATGAGVGGPDVLPYRPFQRSNSLSLIEQRPPGVIAAMAVQDGNLADRDRTTGRRITVEELFDYATTRLRLNYIFWGTEEPYYTSEVLPFLRRVAADASPAASRDMPHTSPQFSANNELALHVADPGAAEAFYTGVLGCEVVSRTPECITLSSGALLLYLLRDATQSHEAVVPSFDVADRAAALRALEAAGCTLVPIGPHAPGAHYVRDPHGVLFDVVERPANAR